MTSTSCTTSASSSSSGDRGSSVMMGGHDRDASSATSGPRCSSRTTACACGRCDLAPGERSDVHRHDLDYLLVFLAGDRIRVEPEPDTAGPYADALEFDVPVGRAVFVERGGVETAINAGTRALPRDPHRAEGPATARAPPAGTPTCGRAPRASPKIDATNSVTPASRKLTQLLLDASPRRRRSRRRLASPRLRGRASRGTTGGSRTPGTPSRARSRAASASSVTQIGSAANTSGAGRPAASAAAVIVGTVCDASVAGPVIHVTVPSATRPASCSIFGPSAAINTGGGGTSVTPIRRLRA